MMDTSAVHLYMVRLLNVNVNCPANLFFGLS